MQSIIFQNDYLNQYLTTNDKEPSWDGHIYVHDDESKRKDTIIGRVPVQVKGTTAFDTEKRKYTVHLSDLNNYLCDGGVIYFIVYITDDKKRTFYRQLLPSDIKGIIQGKENQKTVAIRFNELPKTSGETLSIFNDFLRTREKEMSFISVTPFYIDDIYNSKNSVGDGNISFSYMGKSYLDIFDKVDRGELRVYYNSSLFPIPIPIMSKIHEIRLYEDEKTEIKIDGEVFYNLVTRVRKGIYDVVIQFGDSFSFIVNPDKNIGSFEINMTKNLKYIHSDYNFLLAFIKKISFEIFGHQLSFGSSENKLLNIEKIQRDFNKLQNVVKLFDKLEIDQDFNINMLSERQESNLLSVADSVINQKSIEITKPSKDGFYLKNFNKLDLLFYGIEFENNCEFYNFFELIQVNSLEDDIKRLSGFNRIGVKELLRIDNFKAENIFEIHKRIYLQQSYSGIELLLLKILNYSDSLDSEEERLSTLTACLNFSYWLSSIRSLKDDSLADQLNSFQIKYRMGLLNADDNKKLIEIAEKNETRNEEKFAASVLLGNKSLATTYFELISEEIKESIVNYPIFTLYKELI